MLDFPIVLIDSSFFDGPPQYVCPPVQNFHVGNMYDDQAVLLWDADNEHSSWQISYGPAGTMAGEGTVTNCPIQVGQLMRTDTCSHYVAYVRAVCNHDSVCYSQWSDGVDIYFKDSTAAINTPGSILEQLTYVIPNPASDAVQVMSSFSLTHVEAYSLQGARMLDIATGGLATAFSVRDWPKGVYIVIVHTLGGSTAKKLVVK